MRALTCVAANSANATLVHRRCRHVYDYTAVCVECDQALLIHDVHPRVGVERPHFEPTYLYITCDVSFAFMTVVCMSPTRLDCVASDPSSVELGLSGHASVMSPCTLGTGTHHVALCLFAHIVRHFVVARSGWRLIPYMVCLSSRAILGSGAWDSSGQRLGLVQDCAMGARALVCMR